MARIQKDVVSYFPHDADASAGDTLTVLQGRFGNDGYAFWFKLLEKLASTDGHYLDCRNSRKWRLLLARTGVNEIAGVEIMNLLVEMQAIDKDLWDSKLIWCQELVDNLAEVYQNRRRKVPQKPITTDNDAITTGKNCIICGRNIIDMRSDAKFCSNACRQKAYRVTSICNAEIPQKPITTGDNGITTDDNAITTPASTQSRVEYSKVNKETIQRKTTAENFSLFWETYPKRKSRGQAERAFFKINPDEQLLATMLAAIKRAMKSEDWLKDNGKYIPYPATWLNGKCWDDEFPQKGGNDGEDKGHIKKAGSLKESITKPFG